MKWINPKERKPEGKVFWALIEGRNEQGYRDWAIIRLWNCELGNYRTLDFSHRYDLPETFNCQCWYNTIFAWLPLEEIYINDNDF